MISAPAGTAPAGRAPERLAHVAGAIFFVGWYGRRNNYTTVSARVKKKLEFFFEIASNSLPSRETGGNVARILFHFQVARFSRANSR